VNSVKYNLKMKRDLFLPDFNNYYNTYNMWLNVYFHNLIIYIYILPAVEN